MTKCISILGSTGSIGTQTLEVVDQLGLQVAALTARSNVDLMEQQARKYLPRLVVLYDENAAQALRERLSDQKETEVCSGMEGLLRAAVVDEADTVLTAVVGMVGLQPTLAAIESGKKIALANKGNSGMWRRTGDGGCGGKGRRDCAGGQRALGNFSMPPILPRLFRSSAHFAHMFRRHLLRPQKEEIYHATAREALKKS